jgi:hypothetical protein
MLSDTWDKFVFYVNCYSAIEETHDSMRRRWERPDEGLTRFCRDANPFVWDSPGSFEEELYEGFSASFYERFETGECGAKEGYAFCREWLASIDEAGTYGTGLVAAFDETAPELAFTYALDPVSRQIQGRAASLERTPQDVPSEEAYEAARTPSPADIEAVIALLAKGDEAVAESLRARLADEG